MFCMIFGVGQGGHRLPPPQKTMGIIMFFNYFGTGASPCAALAHDLIQAPKVTDIRSDDLTDGQRDVKISELLKWVKDYPAGGGIRTDDFPAKDHFMSTFLILLKRYFHEDGTPNAFHPILTWHNDAPNCKNLSGTPLSTRRSARAALHAAVMATRR